MVIVICPNKKIVVIYTKGARANISARGEDIREIILQAIKPLENSTGGGHPKAVGAQINTNDADKLKENIINIILNILHCILSYQSIIIPIL